MATPGRLVLLNKYSRSLTLFQSNVVTRNVINTRITLPKISPNTNNMDITDDDI